MGNFGDEVERLYGTIGQGSRYSSSEDKRRQIIKDKERRFGQRIVLCSLSPEYLRGEMKKAQTLRPGDTDYEFYLRKGLFYGEIVRCYSAHLEAEHYSNVCDIVMAELVKVPNGFVVARNFNVLEKTIIDCDFSLKRAKKKLYQFCYSIAKAFSEERGKIPIVNEIK